MKCLVPAVALFAVFANPVWGATKTVTLSVPGMTCSACPITVKVALTKIPGVSNTAVSYEKRQAVVSFDDTKTNAAALTQATANAGFPSSVLGDIR